MFKKGDLAVYPAHGVGVVERIENQEISGCNQEFYVIRILDNNMKIMVPVQNVDSVGLREIIGQNEVPKLYSILKKRDVIILLSLWTEAQAESWSSGAVFFCRERGTTRK